MVVLSRYTEWSPSKIMCFNIFVYKLIRLKPKGLNKSSKLLQVKCTSLFT